MPLLKYTGSGAGEWRTRAHEDADMKYVTASGDNRIVDVDEKTADKLLTFGVFEVADDADDDGEPERPDSQDYDDFASLSGVGPATEDELYDAGYETFEDLRSVSDDDLLAVDGIGESSLGELRDSLDAQTDTDNGDASSPTADSAFDVGGG